MAVLTEPVHPCHLFVTAMLSEANQDHMRGTVL